MFREVVPEEAFAIAIYAMQLREIEQENARLKRLLGEAELDKAALKELLEGKW